jgi:hypothetical protein
MIGNFIKGVDLRNKQCQGIVIDKIVCAQAVALPTGDIGKMQTLPMPLTAYIVLDEDQRSIHIVGPQAITDIGFPEPDPGPDKIATILANG